jgi:transcriptional regulator with XRE-family HTH domain
MNRIGERIKKKRDLLQLQLNELARKVGISPSALSQIEKSKAFPSIITIKSIAENLHTTVGELIGENETLTNNPIVFKTDIKFVEKNEAGTEVYLLSHHDVNKQMDTYLLRLTKGSNLDGLFGNTIGQIFCHVISGEIEFMLENKVHFLKNGDNAYINFKVPYQVKNNSSSICELLWIISPPGL